MLDGVLWVLCSGAAWRDMPERFGPWSTVYQRFRDWRNNGAFDRMLKRLHLKLKENRRLMTRFDKLAKIYASMVSLACAMRSLRRLISYSA